MRRVKRGQMEMKVVSPSLRFGRLNPPHYRETLRSRGPTPTKGKQGQMELIGLVVIVILITLGMLFMAMFALKEEPKKKVFVRKGLAYSTMGALMKTEARCEDYEEYGYKEKRLAIGDLLIEDCAVYKSFGSSEYHCERKDSCVFLNETMGDLLNRTLGEWNKRYELRSILIRYEGEKGEELLHITDEEGKGCLGRNVDRDSSSPFPINTKVGQVENILYLCD